MSKFKVGDKVVFNRENAKSDIDRLVPGADSWLDNVPKGPLTIKEVGVATMQVEECHFLFSPDWFDKYEEPARCEAKVKEGRIKDVKFSGPATIVFWTDGTKTVVKCRKGDKFDPEKGIAMACAKKLLGNEDGYHKEIAKYTKTVEKEDKSPDEMRMELQRYCHGKLCSRGCVISRHRKDPRCVCGMGYGFTTDKNSSAYIKDEDIRVFYKWLKEGLKNG